MYIHAGAVNWDASVNSGLQEGRVPFRVNNDRQETPHDSWGLYLAPKQGVGCLLETRDLCKVTPTTPMWGLSPDCSVKRCGVRATARVGGCNAAPRSAPAAPPDQRLSFRGWEWGSEI